MSNLSITAYIEPIDFRPNGICCPEEPLRKITVSQKDNVVNINAPIVPKGADIDIYNVTALIKQSNKNDIECFYCVSACEEEEQIISDFPTIPPLTTSECMSDCIGQIRWYQGSHEVIENFVKKIIPEDIIYTEVKIPELCGLIGLSLEFEVTSQYNMYYDLRGNGCIPEDNSLKRFYEGVWIKGWSFNEYATSFYPGEQITAYAHFSSVGNCNPMPIAYGYFENRCFTSGVIKGCGLVKDGIVIEGGEHYILNNNWIGDDSLKWYVLFKGNYFWLECSDFSKYKNNDRVIIYKGGIGRIKIGLIDKYHCRNNDSLNKPADNDDVLTDSAVSYVLNPDNDIIMPLGVYA